MLDRIHKISEIIAAFALVASLLFVGVQVNQNTRALNAQEDTAVWLPWLTLSQMIVPSTDFADIMHRGQSGGLDVLREAEQIRFDHFLTATFAVYEQNYRSWHRDPSLFDIRGLRGPVDNYVKVDDNLINKGSREWWAKTKDIFQPPFVAWVEQVHVESNE